MTTADHLGLRAFVGDVQDDGGDEVLTGIVGRLIAVLRERIGGLH